MDGINLGHNFTIRIKKCGPDTPPVENHCSALD